MAHPHFTDRSFEQMARRALSRSSWGPMSPYRDMLVTRARLADARAFLGAHSPQGRKADRRYAIHVRARSAVALVAAELAVAS
jgi:hypothetical protein